MNCSTISARIRRIGFSPSVLFALTINLAFSFVARADYETDFQARAKLLTDRVADVYAPPSSTISDAGKYHWPKVIARLKKYPGDSWSNTQITDFASRDTFHFWFPGMARIMSLYSNETAMQNTKSTYLNKIWSRSDGYNIWTGEGTENHINMSRPNGYLYAMHSLNNPSFPQASTRQNDMKNWMLYWSKKIYENGTGEWDSSTYTVYNIISYLNVYDFSTDQNVKNAARAVLDYYASALALKYTQGVTSGGEMRGGSAIKSTETGTDVLGWLWFGDASTPAWSVNEYIQSIHAATSTYRPPAIAVALARKQLTVPAVYQNSKPSYLLNRSGDAKEIFFVGRNYTLGSTFSSWGGWTGGDNQIVNWKLVARSTSGSTSLVVTGNGAFRSGWRGVGRNPWDQFVQHKNVLIQMSRLPADASTIDSQINSIINSWKTSWQNDFSARFPGDGKPNPVNKTTGSLTVNRSYITYPSSAPTVQTNGVRFVDLQGTYLAVRSLARTEPTAPATAESGRNYVRDEAGTGSICGLVMEVGNSADHGTFANFQSLILAKNGLNKSRLGSESRVVYASLANDTIDAVYQASGTFIEPDFDWDYGPKSPQITITSPPFIQPTWPSGAGHGRLASWSINGVPVSLTSGWNVYDGPNLSLKSSILKLNDGVNVYEVDYSGSLPVFRSSSLNNPPAVSITSPAQGATFTAPASIAINANATDTSPGTVSSVQFLAGTTVLGTDTSSPYSITWSSVAAASYALTAKATDNGGAVSTSSAVNVTVNGTTSTSGGGGTPGTGTGLKGEYFDNMDFTLLKTTRTDSTVNFSWGTAIPTGTTLTSADTYSVRWTGEVQPMYSQTYTFYTRTDDGARLWVNNVLLIDKWVNQGATEWSGTISLTANTKYAIKMEYLENTGDATAQLSWSSASQAKQIIPQSQLYPAASSGGTSLYKINCGGSAVSPFTADANFSGGTTASTTATIDLSGVTSPAPAAVYQTERYGNVTYTFGSLTAGAAHTVRLHFAETWHSAAGSRKFDVSINGTQVLNDYDVFAAAGAKNKAVISQHTANANASGQIVIQFTNVVDNAKISGIEIIKN